MITIPFEAQKGKFCNLFFFKITKNMVFPKLLPNKPKQTGPTI